jgi:hypothetical protein
VIIAKLALRAMCGNAPWKIFMQHHIQNASHVAVIYGFLGLCDIVGVTKSFKISGSCVPKQMW